MILEKITDIIDDDFWDHFKTCGSEYKIFQRVVNEEIIWYSNIRGYDAEYLQAFNLHYLKSLLIKHDDALIWMMS